MDQDSADLEYEFPCYQGLQAAEGIWTDKNHDIYGGVVLKSAFGSKTKLLKLMLPRIQAQLRRQFVMKSEGKTDLFQWSQGSKYYIGEVEGMLQLCDKAGTSLEVRVRGPKNCEKECFFFLEEILGVIDQVIKKTIQKVAILILIFGSFQVLLEMSPGLGVDKSIQSADDLKNHRENIHYWGPQELVKALLTDGFSTKLTNPNTSKVESLADLICFGSTEVKNRNCQITNFLR